MTKETNKFASRLEALLRKQDTLRAALAEARLQQQRRQEREAARIATIVGAALTRAAEDTPSLKLMLTQILQSAELSESDRNFLNRKGW